MTKMNVKQRCIKSLGCIEIEEVLSRKSCVEDFMSGADQWSLSLS